MSKRPQFWPTVAQISNKKDDPTKKKKTLRLLTAVSFPEFDLHYEAGDYLNLEKPIDELKRRVDNDKISQKEADSILDKISHIIYNIKAPFDAEEDAPPARKATKSPPKRFQADDDDTF